MLDDKVSVEEMDEDDDFSSAKQDAYHLFLEQIKGYPVYNNEDNLRLIAEYQAESDPERKAEIQDEIVTGNIRLILKVSNEIADAFSSQSSKDRKENLIMDFIQEGSSGMISAIKDFKAEMNTQFSTLATIYIRNAIFSFLTNKLRVIRIPSHILRKRKLIQNAFEELQKKLHRAPTSAEISARLEGQFSEEEIAEIQDSMNTSSTVPLDVGTDEESSFLDFLPSSDPTPEEMALAQESMEQLRRGFLMLSDMERDILLSRNPMDGSKKKTLNELAKEYDKSVERIRQIEENAKKKLKDFMQSE